MTFLHTHQMRKNFLDFATLDAATANPWDI